MSVHCMVCSAQLAPEATRCSNCDEIRENRRVLRDLRDLIRQQNSMIGRQAAALEFIIEKIKDHTKVGG